MTQRRPAFVVLAGLAVAALHTACASAPPAAQPSPAADAPVAPSDLYAPAALTAADYRHAEEFLSGHLDTLLYGDVGRVQWLDDGRLTYQTRKATGVEVVRVDPSSGRVERGAAPSGGDQARMQMGGGRSSTVASPDGKLGAFIRDWNLWVRDLDSGQEYPVTTDGMEDYGYATNNAGWTRSDRPVVAWSPDSRRLFTFREDDRGVGMMYTVTTNVGHPTLDAWRYPLPTDSVIFRIERLVADVSDLSHPTVTFLDMPPDQHRGGVCDHIYCGGRFSDVQWAPDGESVTFLSVSRDHKRGWLRTADAETGEVRDVVGRESDTFFESGTWGRGENWRILPASNELIWWTRENDWGQLFLHDLTTGARKHAITRGDWNVLTVDRVDPGRRAIWFTGNSREPGDPYFEYLYRVDMDSGDLTLLTPDSANHSTSFSPDGRYFVDEASTPTRAPVTVVRDAWTGDVVVELERADISRMVAAGWRAPIPFEVKARDNTTDLYGIMYVPTNLDPSKKYPVVNYIYPGPQGGSVGSRSFSAVHRDHQAMAELGFIVVSLDALGSSPLRSKSFHDFYYANMGDNGLPDQIAAIRQLADRYGYLDLDRVGVWGHSGGGFASTDAILRYPDFYKVAVSEAGNHDNRNYEDDWGEWWQGLLEKNADGTDNYDAAANQNLAANLEGHLLLAHGMMDDNVPMSNTMLVVKALIDANRDFDLILFPDSRHGFAMHPFMIRNRWDYFVRWLLGAEPPAGYEVGAGGM